MSEQLTATMSQPVTTMSTITDAVETTSRQQKGTLIPSLSDDVALNIIARIPRSDHPHLSLVSKTFYSLLSSPLLYSTRSLLHVNQPSLYVSLRVPPTRSPLWFTLHKTPSNSFLVPLPPSPSPPLLGSAFVAVGHTIYTIGGSHNDIPSLHVWALDCRFRSWESVPAMKIPREFAAAEAVDGRIYVIGGCIVDNWTRSRHWAEVFDPKTGRWEAVDSVGENLLREKWMHASAVVDYKIFAMGDRNGVVYDTRSNAWWAVESELDMGWRGRACVVEGVLYCYDYLGKIQGYDGRRRVWRELRGVEKDLPKFLCGATMANVGGKLVVLWEGKGSGKVVDVWCAEIAVDKTGVEEEEELLGKVLWCNLVYKCCVGSSIVHCLAVDF